MAGRPGASKLIVPVSEILEFDEIRQEKWNFASLLPLLATNESTLQWLARRRLIRNNLDCATCGQSCGAIVTKDSIDGKRWSCRGCGSTRALRHGSFFSNSHLSLKQIIIMIYCWTCEFSQLQIMRETCIDQKSTLMNWCNLLREECATFLHRSANKIGGTDDEGDLIIIELYQGKLCLGKGHRGQWEEKWVCCGVERVTGNCFLAVVPDRSPETLETLLPEYILPCSHIISDDWAAYANIGEIGGGIYKHSVVAHPTQSGDMSEIHTKTIEGLWLGAKRKLRKQYTTSDGLLTTHLKEFMFRNQYRNQDMFANLLGAIAENYM
jgi:transposase-like protein